MVIFQNLVDSAKPLLRKAIQISQQTPYWHCRLLFQLAVRMRMSVCPQWSHCFHGSLNPGPSHCACGILVAAGSAEQTVNIPLQQLHTLEKDLVSACDLLGVGAEYARVVGSEYTRYTTCTFH